MATRFCKIALLIAVGLFFTIVVLNNAIFDYRSNYEFVEHVLSMDTLFSNDTQTWRAFRDPTPSDKNYWLHHAFYWLIIVWEAASGSLCFAGAGRLWKNRQAPAARFNLVKDVAVYGLTLSLLQWFTAFTTVGAEWFLMWQSKIWNGQQSAFRMFTMLGIVLIFVVLRDEEIAD